MPARLEAIEDHRQAVASLFQRYAARVYRALRSRPAEAAPGGGGMARLRDADIDDLVQETFVRALRRCARVPLDQHQDLGPYLVAIARNLRIDLIRKRPWRAIPLDLLDLEGSRAGERAAGPTLHPLLAESQAGREGEDAPEQALADYLASLPPDVRSVYDVRFVRGLSQRRAAEVLSLSRRRIRTLEARLLRGAGRALGKKERRKARRPRAAG